MRTFWEDGHRWPRVGFCGVTVLCVRAFGRKERRVYHATLRIRARLRRAHRLFDPKPMHDQLPHIARTQASMSQMTLYQVFAYQYWNWTSMSRVDICYAVRERHPALPDTMATHYEYPTNRTGFDRP